jgi:S1-C subfamily serine protease
MNQATRRIAQAVEPSVVFVGIEEPLGGGRRMMRSLGSGWVYAKRDDVAFVVTNQHVVKEAARITVQFSDGKRAAATLVGEDAGTDVAVLKVEGAATAVVARRASGLEPQQGDRVYAFGSPFGLKFSMSEGIVSGLGRDPGTFGETYTNYIQSDASVNPGNSGGPLVDSHGRVIGVNTAVILPAQGLCFAVASNLAKFVVGKLILEGRVRRGYLGIGAQAVPLPAKWLNALEIKTKGGIQIQSLEQGGPAEKAGLVAGDVIVQFEGKPLDSIDHLHKALDENTIGRSLSLWALRNGNLKSFTVVPHELR